MEDSPGAGLDVNKRETVTLQCASLRVDAQGEGVRLNRCSIRDEAG